uniref:Uncharacterized protein LOC105139508 n=1 Tax=Rhizophora mucronata TaxID=61149 RepID=A0A2P2JRP9_RHIMU
MVHLCYTPPRSQGFSLLLPFPSSVCVYPSRKGAHEELEFERAYPYRVCKILLNIIEDINCCHS